MKPIALFRVDGGKIWGVSMGHLRRCLLVAEAIAPTHTCVFLMKEYPDGIEYVRSSSDIAIETIPVECDSEEAILLRLEQLRPSHLFVDLVKNPYDRLFEAARQQGTISVVFDILGTFRGSPDFVVNDSIVDSFVRYGQVDPHTRFLLGPDFFIMQAVPVPTRHVNEIRRLLITMGGADPAGLTAKIVRAIRPVIENLECVVVLGPAFAAVQEIQELVQDDVGFSIERNPTRFMELLAEQDLIVSSAGRTLYECACLGKPVITVPSIAHEEVTAKAFQERASYLNVDRWDDFQSPDRLVEMIGQYRHDAALRIRVGKCGRSIVDGRGLERVLGALRLNP